MRNPIMKALLVLGLIAGSHSAAQQPFDLTSYLGFKAAPKSIVTTWPNGFVTTYTFEANGLEATHDNGSAFYSYTFDPVSNELNVSYSWNGTLRELTVYGFDEASRLLYSRATIFQSSTLTLYRRSIVNYDEHFTIATEHSNTSASPELDPLAGTVTVRHLDADGRTVRTEYEDHAPSVSQFGEHGFLIEESSIREDGGVNWWSRYEYELDEHGNWISRTKFEWVERLNRFSTTGEVATRVITYY